MDPDPPSVDPEAPCVDPDTLSVDPDTLSVDPDTLSVDPGTLSVDPDVLPGAPPGPTPSPDDPEPPDLECAVCFSQFNNIFNTPKKLTCGHTFCLECLARMTVKSSVPESLQCPLCRASTVVPALGPPKLSTDATVLSYLPAAMQHVYSIRFNRNKGRLQVKRPPASGPAHQPRSLDVGTPEDPGAAAEGAEPGSGSHITWLLRDRLCRLIIFIILVLVLLTVAVVTVYYLVKK